MKRGVALLVVAVLVVLPMAGATARPTSQPEPYVVEWTAITVPPTVLPATATPEPPLRPIYEPTSTRAPQLQPRVRQPKAKAEPIPTSKPKPPKVGHSGGVRGVATWYCNVGPPFPSRCTAGYPASGAYAAAGPELRRALGRWRGRTVYVNGVRVKLVDWCACGGDHVIDVYHDTWVRIPHQSSVVVTW